MFRLVPVLGFIGLAALVVPQTASASSGTVSYTTLRSCSSVTAADPCDGSGPGQTILTPPSDLEGGLGTSSTSAFSVSDGSATGQASFGANGFPILTGSSNAVGDVRVNDNEMAFFSFTNSGATAVPLSIDATFSYTGSSGAPETGTFPGGSLYDAFVAIVDPSLITGPTDPQSLFSDLYGSACGTAGVFAASEVTSDTSGGAGSAGVSSAPCTGSQFEVAPGQTVLIVDGFQIPANRGGSVSGAVMTITALPEPGAWAMMIAGFGLAGAALRRRRAGAKLAV